MSFVAAGKSVDLIALIVIWVLTFYALWMARQGKTKDIKPLPGIPAMLEGINKATEEGKPVIFVHCGKLYGPDAMSVLACLNVCSFVSQNVAKLNANFISVAMEYPEVYPIMVETVREAYAAAGATSAFKEDFVRYYPGYSYTMEVMGLIEQSEPGAIVYMGAWDHSSIIQSTVGSGDPMSITTIFAQDLFRIVTVVLLVMVALAATVGFADLNRWLGM